MDKLEELERQIEAVADTSEWPTCSIVEEIADKVSALRRDYVLVPREPTQEDVERVARALCREGAIDDDWAWRDYVDDARAAWASIVGGTDET